MSTTSTASSARAGRFGVLPCAKARLHVLQPFARDAAANRFEHLPLDVLRVDDAVGPDAARQLNREPAGAGADVGDRRAVRDPQRVHDLVGLLPRVAIGPFEQAEILRRKQPAVLLRRETPARQGGPEGPPLRPAQRAADRRRRRRGGPAGPRWRQSLHFFTSPTTPGTRHRLGRQDRVELRLVHQAAFEHDLAG